MPRLACSGKPVAVPHSKHQAPVCPEALIRRAQHATRNEARLPLRNQLQICSLYTGSTSMHDSKRSPCLCVPSSLDQGPGAVRALCSALHSLEESGSLSSIRAGQTSRTGGVHPGRSCMLSQACRLTRSLGPQKRQGLVPVLCISSGLLWTAG